MFKKKTVQNYNILVIFTGGDLKIVKKVIKNHNFIHPYLLMEGLNHIIALHEDK